MRRFRKSLCSLLLFAALAVMAPASASMPVFGRDTVLVWSIRSGEYDGSFVVRIAEFLPDRLLEWEDEQTQGTVFMAARDLEGAKAFATTRMFESGINTNKKGVTTLWLSGRIFRDLKEKKKARCTLDGVPAVLTNKGEEQIEVEVNRSVILLPAIRVADDRSAERWFLDDQDNPLLLKHQVRQFTQTLTSVTTDRKGTLRWLRKPRI